MCEITGLLEKICGPNAAGISAIALFNKKEITTLPAPDVDTGIATTAIVMAATKKGFEIPITEESADFEEPLDGDVDAQTIKPMLKFAVAGRVPATVAKVQKMIGGKYIAVITYLDGTRHIVGTLVTPLRLRKADFKAGVYGSNTRKGFEFELGCSSAIYSYQYTGVYDTTIVNFT
jgi:hypothetical protein